MAETKPAVTPTKTATNPSPPVTPQPTSQKSPTQVTFNDGRKLTVPSLVGLPMRKVIEVAYAAGLDVQFTGSGTAREQAPAPGTQVPVGTKIVVRCGR
jgi:cell division protein FtsI (penicillin-binding protein 3)